MAVLRKHFQWSSTYVHDTFVLNELYSAKRVPIKDISFQHQFYDHIPLCPHSSSKWSQLARIEYRRLQCNVCHKKIQVYFSPMQIIVVIANCNWNQTPSYFPCPGDYKTSRLLKTKCWTDAFVIQQGVDQFRWRIPPYNFLKKCMKLGRVHCPYTFFV